MTRLDEAPAPVTRRALRAAAPDPVPAAASDPVPAAPDTLPGPVATHRAETSARTGAGDRAVAGIRFTQRAVLNVAAVLGTISIVVSVLCLLFGIRPAVVISGSMEPGIPVGSLTVSRTVPAEQVQVGDVVTVPRVNADGLVTHRVVATTPADDGRSTVLELQGDANRDPDLLPYVVTEVGHVLTTVPGVGTLVQLLQQNVVAVVAGLLVVTVLVTAPVDRLGGRRSGGDAAR
ncbi:signal peptidase I [Cellulomonas sp. PS-H5]|uniref:signal peptidase I n=1 Tax=Cellulomonas sp. PS-H5 TaxID=2820400 RepID=UPI001C4F9DCE|nr:signal peptidase I [Cellulomonas sp. PS-H5]MBW0252649.1 signal peptidase I [Cellulomonas sp. PS-H5]